VTRAVRVAPQGTARMIGARLRPDAARRLTGVPQHEIVDTIVPVAQIDRRLARVLRDDVTSRESAVDMAAALDRALVRSASASPPRAPLGCAVETAIGRAGLVRVTELADQADVGTRQLERLFQDHVGLSPKLFLRILRFQHVLSSVRDGRGDTAWAEIAARHGFYDQSHFIRDFKAFVGAAPGAFHVEAHSLASLFSAIARR
jgi:AraC-like DNA-binding protein